LGHLADRFGGAKVALICVLVEATRGAGRLAETVYKPDILDRRDTIYKQPGYNPLR
jgi:hypothetical protein